MSGALTLEDLRRMARSLRVRADAIGHYEARTPVDPIRTFVGTGAGEVDAMNRPGFAPVCMYGAMTPEIGEIGGIFRSAGPSHISNGMFVQPVEVIERIFVRPKEPEGKQENQHGATVKAQ